jgi:uncharacterized cupredoxin-like copper-binding protein
MTETTKTAITMGISQLRLVDQMVTAGRTELRTIALVAVAWVACIDFSSPVTTLINCPQVSLPDKKIRRSIMKAKMTLFLLYFYLTALTGVALAAGNHPGEHGHGNVEGVGKPGSISEVDRTVNIEMNDEMRFVPDKLTVKQGETIKFVMKNVGEMEHEFVLGTEKELLEHYEKMEKNPEMAHEDPNMIRVAPGQVGEVVWNFIESGKVDFACLISGHYDAGMKGAISIKKP